MEDEDVQLSATCTVVTKWLEFDAYKSRIKTLRVLVGSLVALNLVEGIEKLKSSPLLPSILHPETKTYSLSENSNRSGVLKSFRYQHLQVHKRNSKSVFFQLFIVICIINGS